MSTPPHTPYTRQPQQTDQTQHPQQPPQAPRPMSPGGPHAREYPSQAPPQPMPPGGHGKQRNTLGIIALVVAVVGFVFACIPGALLLGWVLLPIAFVLGLVALFLPSRTRGTALAAVIIAIVGTVVGFSVFAAVVDNAVDDAFGGGDLSVSTPADSPGAAAPAAGGAADGASQEGTRAHPYPLGTQISQGDWAVTVNSVSLDADSAVAAGNSFNDPAPAGSQYLLANVTITYDGDDPQGSMPMTSIAYVTAAGNTVDSYTTMAVTPDRLDNTATLYEGASTTGNVLFTVPSDSAADGTLAVRATPLGDKVFVAVG